MSNIEILEEDEQLHSPMKKMKRLLKKTYVELESPSYEKKGENDVILANEVNSQNISLLETNEKIGSVEKSPEEIENPIKVEKKKERKKLVKNNENKPKNKYMEAGAIVEKPEKKFLSIFEDSEPENNEEIQENNNEVIEVEEQEVKQKKQRKPKKKVEKDNQELQPEIVIDENLNEQNENQETKSKKPRKLKLVRERKNKNPIIEEENPEDQINSEQKLNRLKKRAKKNILEENCEENPDLILEEDKKDGSFIVEGDETKPKKTKKPKKTNSEKKVKEVKKTESTQEILERLRQDPLFHCDEEDEDDDRPNLTLENNDAYFGIKREPQRKKLNAKNHLIIKTRNKFFKEINTLDLNGNLDDQPPMEEVEGDDYDNQQEFLLEIVKKPKAKIDVHSFLDKFHKFKEERALNVTSQSNNNNGRIMEITQNVNSNLIPANENVQTIEPEKEKDDIMVLPRQGDLLLQDPDIVREHDTQNELKNGSNLVESQENNLKKRPTFLKATSQEMSQFLNNTLSNFSSDERSNLSLLIAIPNLTKMNSNNITDTTLFVNRLARSNSFLNKSLLSLGGLTSQAHSFSQNGTNLDNREVYKNKLIEEIRKRKSKNLNLKDLQDRFKQTDWAELTAEKKKNDEKKLKENGVAIDDDEEDDSDYNPEEKQATEKSKNQEGIIDFKRIIQLEEGEDNENDAKEVDNENENENENQNEESQKLLVKETEGEILSPSNEINKEFMPQNSTLDTYQGFSQEPANHQQITNSQEAKIFTQDPTLDSKIDHVIGEIKDQNNERMAIEEENILDFEEQDTKALKKLRKIAENSVVNYAQAKERRQAERKARREAMMNDPNRKKFMQSMFEMEAELGSDNEENDDIVKRINKNEADENDSGDEMDEDLKEMIDNITTNQEGENELLWNKFYDDIVKQDKENLKKVLERAFNIKKRKSDDFGIGDTDRMNKKMSMIEERIKLLEERENYFHFDAENGEKSRKEIEVDDLLDEREDNKMRLHEINMKMRKEVLKKSSKLDENQVVDKNILHLIEKQKHNSKTNFSLPIIFENECKNSNSLMNLNSTKEDTKPKESSNFMNNNKFRNSVLQIKMNKANNICIFNNSYNKDVINEFGNKLNFQKTDENKPEFNVPVKIQTETTLKNTHSMTTSLNKFFSQRNVDLTRPSPNKVFFFGVKK